MEINEHLRERLDNLQKQRQVERQKRKECRDNEESNQKLVAVYLEEFGKKRSEIEGTIVKLSLGLNNSSSIPDILNETSKEIVLLQKYYTNSTLFLPQHDAKRSQEMIQDLQQRFQDLEEKLLPRKKFGFKDRKACTGKDVKKDIPVTKFRDDVDGHNTNKFSNYSGDEFGVKNRINETIIMHAISISKQDVSLSALFDCKVILLGSPSTLHITGLTNCTVLCGPVATSVFASECEDCKFVVPCQQLRIHQSKNCDLYLYVRSRAIIEDCADMRFAPFNWRHESVDELFEELGWDINDNNWCCVDDFNWLAADKPSPNWKCIPECDRLANWEYNIV